MRQAITLCNILLLLVSCNDHKKVQDDVIFLPVSYDYKKIEGVYFGDFGGSNIHISLRHVNGKHALGYRIYKGQKRNFAGNINPEGAGFRLKLNEPGNNQSDGIFDFILDTATFSIKGSWTPNDKAKLTAKNYTFSRMWDTVGHMLPFDDSISRFIFESDGLCTYHIYSKQKDQRQASTLYAKGNWTVKGLVIIIDWEPNELFPERSEFKVHEEPMGNGYFSAYILVNGRKLHENPGG